MSNEKTCHIHLHVASRIHTAVFKSYMQPQRAKHNWSDVLSRKLDTKDQFTVDEMLFSGEEKKKQAHSQVVSFKKARPKIVI